MPLFCILGLIMMISHQVGLLSILAPSLELSPDVDIRHIGGELTGGNGTGGLKGHADDPEEIEAAREAASKARE